MLPKLWSRLRERIICRLEDKPFYPSIQSVELDTMGQKLTPDGTDAMQYDNFTQEFASMANFEQFDGFRCDVTKELPLSCKYGSSTLGSATLQLGCKNPTEGYSWQVGPIFQRNSSLLAARIGNDGMLNLRAAHNVSPSVQARLMGAKSLTPDSRGNSDAMWEAAIEHTPQKNGHYAGCLKIASSGALVINTAFSRMLSPALKAGGEMTWIANNNVSTCAYGLRYARGLNVVTTSVARQPDFAAAKLSESCHQWKTQFVRKISDRLSLGTELGITHDTSGIGSSLRFVTDYMFRNAKVQGMVDTSGKVAMLAHEASGIAISGSADFAADDYNFGLLFSLAPDELGSKTAV